MKERVILDPTSMKLCVLVPAYKCGDLVAEVCRRVPLAGPEDEIIVVDDCSPDDTSERARSVPRVVVYRNSVNLGYGGTSHRLYDLAFDRGADIAVTVHGDLGHRPEDIPLLTDAFRVARPPDIVVGSRLLYLFREAKRRGWGALLTNPELRRGMPIKRLLGHVVLTQLQNLVYRSHLYCFHEGMRACRREVIQWIAQTDFPVGYGYDTELVYQAHRRGLKIHEVPVPPNYDRRVKTAAPPYRYGLHVLRHILRVANRGR